MPDLAPVVLTCGDPAGVGPELAVLAAQAIGAQCKFYWLGDARHLPSGAEINRITRPEQARRGQALNVLHSPFPAPAIAGQPDPRNAEATKAVIAQAVAQVQSGAALALCTSPINKAALKAGCDFPFPGHTEYLAHLAGGAEVVMMLACPSLRVVPATIHIALRDVPAAFTPAVLRQTVAITAAGLKRDFGIAQPRLAIAGLNPHAGEGGAMGHEEQEWMVAEIAALQAQGYALQGPLPADTLFHARARATYDAAICAYHDQALIPIKTLDFDGGVNVTLGLPFIRTSPDHGTAYDIAGLGRALPQSLIAALTMAEQMGQARLLSTL